ncbi:MAG: T9SS type A sorting domain-containing protein [Crocinitomicaceae bacterium]|nr:T9SS type A sorting domain-containing protein [Crocinitomicaceae bacterium]
MKKILLSLAVVANFFTISAQLADGSVAPDFTVNDINGNSHTLSTYLAAGKTVIMDISATWCGPCWGYHNSHILSDLHNAYGPGGSDEVVVLFVEGDGSTTIDDLNGTGAATIGDWVTGTPYPIIDDASLSTLYQIGYYPTIYRICPDGAGGGTVYEQGQSSLQDLVAGIGSCGTALTGVADHVSMNDAGFVSCSPDGSIEVSFKNFGNNTITSADIALKENGTVVVTEAFSGSVASLAEGTHTFASTTFNVASTYTAEILDVNGNAPVNSTLAEGDISINVSNAVSGTLDATIEIVTDRYGSETTWELIDGSGTVVQSGGPYQDLSTNDVTVQPVVNVTLNNNECYTMIVDDSYGDGMDAGYGAGSFAIKNEAGVAFISGGVFTYVAIEAATGSNDAASIDESTIADVNIFPNPAVDLLNVSFEASDVNYTVSIKDLSGRVVATEGVDGFSGVKNVAFNVADIAEGSYIVVISSTAGVYTQNVVIK